MSGDKKLFAIGDLHLSLANEKPMDIFGLVWENHTEKIKSNWINTVGEEDTVIIAGDISWAMNMEDAKKDLDFINSLPGNKVLIKGNHDYWWSSVSRLNSMYKNMFFLQNDFYLWENIAVCGSRGWMLPIDPKFKKEDEKILNREVKRSILSIESAIKKGHSDVVFVSHYPPAYKEYPQSVFTDIIEKYGIKKAVYGHFHGEENFSYAIDGLHGNVEYKLVSGDYVLFVPQRIF